MTSSLRRDPATREWVIVAPGRGQRPRDRARAAPGIARPGAPEPSCPFCPGNEAQAPAALWEAAGPGGAWAARVVPNKFPALVGDGEPHRREAGPLFREMDGVGHHEVIVETPVHDRTLAFMSEAEVELVLRAYQARYRAVREDTRIQCIVIFKNHGERAGTSLAHPHSQLVATPVAPMQMRRKYAVAIAHWDDTGRCLYCDVAEAEVRAGVRMVLATERFVVFHPFASRAPFETWIVPTRHQASFGEVSAEDLAALAPVLRRTLAGLHAALDDPDFNLVLHTAPVEDEGKAYYLWHLQIVPRVATIAGFELGSGIFITTVRPEESAARVRDLMAEQASAGRPPAADTREA